MIAPTARRRGLLQTFRAFQALAEVTTIAVPEGERSWWDASPFDLSWTVGTGRPVPVTVDHDLPSTRIGDVMRPLIFPHQFFDLYRQAWTARTVRASFMGGASPTRRRSIDEWQRRNGPATVVWSDRGKRWPGKAWDPAYVTAMTSTRYALCPVAYVTDRVFWGYRFFDACAAGALPVVDRAFPIYDGFTFGLMSDPVDSLEWSPAVAEANFCRVRDLLTVPHGELAAAC